jgi:hypothetical protein
MQLKVENFILCKNTLPKVTNTTYYLRTNFINNNLQEVKKHSG